MHKHIIAIKEFCSVTKDALIFNEHNLKEYLLSSSCSAEHFFINKSHKVEYTYGDKNSTAEIQLPKKLLKYISAPVNYIYLDSNANMALGNSSIKEKIEKLSTMGKLVFASEENYHLFYLSAGEMQILVSCIIWAMFKVSGRREMFIFDTPLARLDEENRITFSKNIVSTISGQVVILSTDSEFTGKNYRSISNKIAREYLLDYDDKAKITKVKTTYFGENKQ